MAGALRALGLTVAVLLLPGAAMAQMPDSTEVVDVRFVGAEVFSGDVLATAILTTPTHCGAIAPICWFGVGVEHEFFDEIAAEQDVLRLRVYYAQHGYRQAQVTLAADTLPAGISVTFTIVEGPPVRVASIEVRNAEGLAGVERNLPLRQGQPFDLLLYAASEDTLQNRMQNRGFASAIALKGYDAPADSLVAHVYFELVPGPHSAFGRIDVTGAVEVTPSVVRKMLTFLPGDPYSRDDLLRSQRNLFGQDVFRHAEIRTSPDPQVDSLVNVEVLVSEGDLHRVRAGAGLSSAEYLVADGRWASRNFFGGARRLEVSAQLANLFARTLAPAPFFDDIDDFYGVVSGQLAVDFTQPWFFAALNTFTAGVFIERRSIPGVFVRTGGGGSLGFQRAVGSSATLQLGYRPELTRLESADGDLVFCVSFTACDDEQIEALTEYNWLAPLTAGVVWDRSNSIFAPNRGWVIRFNTDYAARFTGSDFSYTRFYGDFIDYSAIIPRYIVATRLSPGIAIPHQNGAGAEFGIHPTRRFFAGGPNSVRGYAQYRLGPKALTIDPFDLIDPSVEEVAGCSPQQVNDGACDAGQLADRDPDAFRVQPLGGAASLEGSVELRFPIFRESLRGATFVDFGQVWPEYTDVSLGDIVFTPGAGIRYFSPIGPIRVDVGYNFAQVETVRVFTTRLEYCPEGGGPCEDLEPGVEYPRDRLHDTRVLQAQNDVMWNPRQGSFLKRLQLHFSIGQAF